jgi:hypothetical protein
MDVALSHGEVGVLDEPGGQDQRHRAKSHRERAGERAAPVAQKVSRRNLQVS